MTVPEHYRVALTVLPDPTRTLRILKVLHRSQLRMLLLIAVPVAVIAAFASGGFPDGSTVLLATLPLMLVLVRLSWERGMRKAARRPDNPLNQPLSFEFSEEGVRMSTPNSATVHRWAAFTKVTSRGEFWLLYLSRQHLIVIPHAAFTPDQDQAFRQLLATRLGYTPEP